MVLANPTYNGGDLAIMVVTWLEWWNLGYNGGVLVIMVVSWLKLAGPQTSSSVRMRAAVERKIGTFGTSVCVCCPFC
jgi:hypothetical protein